MPTCALCAINFTNFKDFKTHVVQTHRADWRKEIPDHRPDIVPYNLTGRSKDQIVNEAEASWLKEIIVETEPFKRSV